MKTSANRLVATVLGLCILGMFALGLQVVRAQGMSAEQATKRLQISPEQATKMLQEKGAKFLSKKDFDGNPLVLKTKGGARPFFTCTSEFCTCTGASDCMDMGLDSGVCNLAKTYVCNETPAGPSCVCSR